MSVSINEYHPTTMTHPGAFLSDKLEEMSKKPEEFAQEIGASEAVILDIVNDKGSITQELAEAFEKALKIPTHFWMRGQQMYDECLTRQTEEVNA